MAKRIKSNHNESEIIIREENGMHVLEVRMSETLRKKMEKLAIKTSGANMVPV